MKIYLPVLDGYDTDEGLFFLFPRTISNWNIWLGRADWLWQETQWQDLQDIMEELTNQMRVNYKKKFVNKEARAFSSYSNIFHELQKTRKREKSQIS